MGCHLLLQGIFPTQGLNLGLLWLLQCRQILYHLSHQGCSWWGQINKILTEDLQRRFPLTPAPGGSALLAAPVRALSWVLVPGKGQHIGPTPTLQRSLDLQAPLQRKELQPGHLDTESGYLRETSLMFPRIQQKWGRLPHQPVMDPACPRGTPPLWPGPRPLPCAE